MNKSLILVVEDDTSVRNLITTTLKTHEYRYLTAPDGQSAILETSSHNPDIVLLDLGLPDIDGVEIKSGDLITVLGQTAPNKIKVKFTNDMNYLTKILVIQCVVGDIVGQLSLEITNL